MFEDKNKKRRFLSLVLVVLIIGIISLTIIYASLNTTLNITGSVDVVAATWDVHFENATFITAISNNIDNDYEVKDLNYIENDYKIIQLVPFEWSSSCIDGNDCINATSGTSTSFTTAALKQPGDIKVISLDIVNAGSIDAKLDGYVLSGISPEQDVYLNYYVKYDDGSIPTSGNTLNVGETKTVLLVLEFDKNVTSSQLPTTEQSLNLTFTMNYVQN